MEITEAQYERIKDALPVQRGNVRLKQPATAECSAVCGRARLQMARFTEAFRQLAYDLHADESLVQGRRPGSGL